MKNLWHMIWKMKKKKQQQQQQLKKKTLQADRG